MLELSFLGLFCCGLPHLIAAGKLSFFIAEVQEAMKLWYCILCRTKMVKTLDLTSNNNIYFGQYKDLINCIHKATEIYVKYEWYSDF